MRSGAYVRATRMVDYAPYTLIVAGEVGRVLAQIEDVVLIRLLRRHPGLGEGNVVTLMPEDAEAFVLTVSPVIIKRAIGAAATAAGLVMGVLLLPHIDLLPPPARAEALERTYLTNGPTAVTRINLQPDGRYMLITLVRSRPGSKLYIVTEKREIAAEDVDTELAKLE